MITIKFLYVGARLLNFDSDVNEISINPDSPHLFSKPGNLPCFLNNKIVVAELGNIIIDGIKRSSYVYQIFSYEHIKSQGYPIDNRRSDAELGIKLVGKMDGEINRFLNALWFVKDNSVFSDASQYINDISKIALYSSQGEYFSDASGEIIETNFSEKELDEAGYWFDYITDHTVMKIIGDVSYEDIAIVGNGGKDKIILSSFKRSLLYLNSARKSFFVPAKIASYISLLETLFAVKNDNTQNISKRLSVFIGETEDEKLLIYKNMKKLYDVRSSYVHGSDIKNNINQKLVEFSIILDDYIRRTMRKILIEHIDLNYGEGTNKKFKEVNEWFESLVNENLKL